MSIKWVKDKNASGFEHKRAIDLRGYDTPDRFVTIFAFFSKIYDTLVMKVMYILGTRDPIETCSYRMRDKSQNFISKL